jgi:hypothetical protein
MITPFRNAFALAKSLAENKVCHIAGAGAPKDGTTGINVCGRGSFYTDTDTGVTYVNTGSDKNQNWGIFGGVTSPTLVPVPVTVAELTAGKVLVPANATYKIKLSSVTVTALGGDAAGVTTVDITGTQAAVLVKLAQFPVALLKKDVPVTMQTAGVILLPQFFKSFQGCDINTPISIAKTGGALTGATSLDVKVAYALIQ